MKINIPNQSEIIDTYGVTNQFGIHMEECAELIQAISKCNRAWCDWEKLADCKDNLIEEIADVLICIEQLKFIFNIPDYIIENMIEYKYKRQLERIKNDSRER